jgi:hypothetical protein
MKITAAVVSARSAPFEIETLDLTAPLADEVLVRLDKNAALPTLKPLLYKPSCQFWMLDNASS